MTRPKRHKPGLRSLYQWHRWLGLAVAAMALLLAVTGLLLNHTEALALKHRHANAPWLLAWYGIRAPEGVFYPAGEHWLSQWGTRLFLDEREIGTSTEPLVGVVHTSHFIAVASATTLQLFTPDGRLIDRMERAAGLPADIQAIAMADGDTLLLRTAHGTFAGDTSLADWRPATATHPWSSPAAAPALLAQRLAQHFVGAGLPLERLVLDLHSGRLFGAWGVYVVDASALLLIFNAGSGALLWWRRRRHEKRHPKHPSGTHHAIP